MTALDLIKQGWCQNDYHKVIDGKYYYCSHRAIFKAYGPNESKIYLALCKFREVIGHYDISDWNDDPARTHKQVIEAFEKARV